MSNASFVVCVFGTGLCELHFVDCVLWTASGAHVWVAEKWLGGRVSKAAMQLDVGEHL